MEDFKNKSYEERIQDIKNNLYAGGGAGQANVLLNVMMSSFSQREFTGHSDISVDNVLSNISQEMKHLKRVVRDGGIVPIKFFESQFKGCIRQHDCYACLDKNLRFCVKHYGEDDWKDILYVFPYMNSMTAFDVSFKNENIHQSDLSI
jgi:hypothetical protein